MFMPKPTRPLNQCRKDWNWCVRVRLAYRSPWLAGTVTGEAEFEDPPSDPLVLFQEWLAEADRRGVSEARAFVLATSDAHGRASERVVLLKDMDERGLIFTTHLDSRKGRELASTRWAGCVFHWRETLQQVTVAGSPADQSGPHAAEVVRR